MAGNIPHFMDKLRGFPVQMVPSTNPVNRRQGGRSSYTSCENPRGTYNARVFVAHATWMHMHVQSRN